MAIPHSKPKRKKVEQSMQIGLSEYIKLQYPDVIFTAESSGIHSTIGLAVRKKRMRSTGTHLDMIILEPRGAYCGCMLECKSLDDSPFLANGELSQKKHVQDQAKMLDRLKRKGYYTSFAVGIDQGMTIIKRYMNQPDQHDGTR